MVKPTNITPFNGQRALIDVQYQTKLGARTPGSIAHDQVVSWIEAGLIQAGWQVEFQDSTLMDHPVRNIVARLPSNSDKPWIILGAHYDSRLYADQDPDLIKRTQPVPGANDGASGVAILLEIARDLPKTLNLNVWLVFFDDEDNGNIPGWDWLLGSRAFVETLQGKPDAVVVVDMVGDTDLNLYYERNSSWKLSTEIWAQAAALGYSRQFITLPKYRMLDDHTPFLQAGIPAVDIIDFDYPYWHTTADTADKVSAQSLKAVGTTLLAWLEHWQ
jgi:glutaminyl-peptide cyclotransferase